MKNIPKEIILIKMKKATLVQGPIQVPAPVPLILPVPQIVVNLINQLK